MKKLILSLTLLLAFGLSYGINPAKAKKNNDNFFNKDLINSLDSTNDFNLIEIRRIYENEVDSMCSDFAIAVGTAAFESGYSLQTSLKLTFDAKTVCDILVGIGSLINRV